MKKFSFDYEIISLTFYFMALMGITFIYLPNEAFAIFGGKPVVNDYSILLGISGFFFAIGLVSHLIIYRLNPNKFKIRAFLKAGISLIVVIAVFFLISMILSHVTGLPPDELKVQFTKWFFSILVVIFGISVAILAIAAIYFFVTLKYHPANRIARKCDAGDFSAAIRLAEALPLKKRDFLTNFNLATAYALSNNKEKAEELLHLLEQTKEIPKYCTEETMKQFIENLRNSISQIGVVKKDADESKKD